MNGLGGRHYLEYKNGKVFGPIQDNIDSISLDEFRENIDNCIKLKVSSTEIENTQDQTRIYPNPVVSELQIINESREINSVEIFGLNGRRVRRWHGIKRRKFDLDLKNIDPGIYLISITTSLGIETKKMIKY